MGDSRGELPHHSLGIKNKPLRGGKTPSQTRRQPYQPKHHQSQKQLLPIKFSQQILNQTLTINLLESQLLNFLSTALSYCHRGFALPQNVKSILRFLSTDGTTRLRDYLLVEKIRFCWEEVISHFPQKKILITPGASTFHSFCQKISSSPAPELSPMDCFFRNCSIR
jgi:hypothetical protein